MRVAAVQASPIFLDSAATTDKILLLLREAAQHGAKLVVFPEVFISGYPVWLRVPSVAANDELLRMGQIAYLKSAIRLDGPEIGAIVKEAAARNVFVYVGFVELGPSRGSLYSSLAAIHPEHGVVGLHRKIKPTFQERLVWSDGDGKGLKVHDWGPFHLGGLICFENWLPLARHALYAQGLQIHIAVWPGDLSVTTEISRFVALEGGVYVISCSGILESDDIGREFPLRDLVVDGRTLINDGGSMIVAPDGSILAGPLEDTAGILYAEVSIDAVLGQRMKRDAAGHYSRNDIFRLSVNHQRLDALLEEDSTKN